MKIFILIISIKNIEFKSKSKRINERPKTNNCINYKTVPLIKFFN